MINLLNHFLSTTKHNAKSKGKLVVGLFCAGIFLATTAHAENRLQGRWIGWGYWTYEGSGDRCEMALEFRDSETMFERHKGQFNCTVVTLSLPAQSWLKKGTDLVLEDQVVGQILDDSLTIQEKYNEKVTVETKIKVEARHLDYEEIWRQENKSVLYTIKGRLFLRD